MISFEEVKRLFTYQLALVKASAEDKERPRKESEGGGSSAPQGRRANCIVAVVVFAMCPKVNSITKRNATLS